MENREPRLGIMEYEAAREAIALAIDNETYVAYAIGSGPLTWNLLPEELIKSDEFEHVVVEFGWPSLREDSEIEPAYNFESNELFLDSLVGNLQEYSPASLGSFRGWLEEPPTKKFYAELERISEVYGTHPALHRLHVLAPELLEPTQSIFRDMRARSNGDNQSMIDELSLGMNTDVVTAARMVYSLLGRLIKTTDKALQAKILDPNSDRANVTLITSALEELRT